LGKHDSFFSCSLCNNVALLLNADGGRFGGGGRGGRGHDAMVGKCIKIKSGPYKGYRGRVKEVTGVLVRVELDSLMKIVTGK
jgi:transcription elongation factor SPT5